LPNRFPPAQDGSDLRLLAGLFTPEQADLAAALRPELETPAQISRRLARGPHETASLLKEMSQKGQHQRPCADPPGKLIRPSKGQRKLTWCIV
jgi:hypothetical protein